MQMPLRRCRPSVTRLCKPALCTGTSGPPRVDLDLWSAARRWSSRPRGSSAQIWTYGHFQLNCYATWNILIFTKKTVKLIVIANNNPRSLPRGPSGHRGPSAARVVRPVMAGGTALTARGPMGSFVDLRAAGASRAPAMTVGPPSLNK